MFQPPETATFDSVPTSEAFTMKGSKWWEIGGFVAGGALVVIGAVALWLGVDGYQTVHDELSQEYIVGGKDMSPEEIKAAAEEAKLPDTIQLPSCNVVDKTIDNGDKARCFASYMRIHALEATGGLTYSQMGRFQASDNPGDAKGTNDPEAAAKDESGNPVSNAQRNLWVTETALATALNVSYMAEKIALFGIVVGIALVLTGIGLIILAYSVFGRARETSAPASAGA
jgi:hypothetical protein